MKETKRRPLPDTISKESRITNTLIFLPLSKSKKYWAQIIKQEINQFLINRDNYKVDEKYSIMNTTKKILNSYAQHIR